MSFGIFFFIDPRDENKFLERNTIVKNRRIIMKTILILFLFMLVNCSRVKENMRESLALLNRYVNLMTKASIANTATNMATISGKAMKGVIKGAVVNVYPINKDGSCNTTSSVGSGLTDSNGNYEVSFQRTGNPVCVIVTPGSSSKMQD